METIYDLPAGLEDELDRFSQETERFKSGAISAIEFRAFRVPHGVYEQREAGTFMLRVRCPAGQILPHQMRTLARAAATYGNGVLHVTTRQDIQVHGAALDDVHPALVELYGAGLSCKGGGGNTVRNITACFDAGVCGKEAFDVAPHAVALTEFLVSEPRSFNLPRKYKIAFSGCSDDCAGATINDLGFIAKQRGAERGFTVYVGGGMGAHSRTADVLEEFVPVGDACLIAEAVKRVFDTHGNRKDRHKARLRFLVERIGLEAFRALCHIELNALRAAGLRTPALHSRPWRERFVPETKASPAEGFAAWLDRNTVGQKQDGYRLAHVPLVLGDISSDTLHKLAGVVESHGEGIARTTQSQNLVIRSVHENELPAVHRALVELGLAEPVAPIVRDTTACAGAATCTLGICLSRGLARAVVDELVGSGLDLDALRDLNMRISGCPNGCGRHPIGRIGLFGVARRMHGRLVPHYTVQLGGRVGEARTRLAEGSETIPARNVPAFVVELLQAFRSSPQHPDYDDFLDSQDEDWVACLAAKHKHVASFDEDKNYYFDWGAEAPFSLAGRGPGECGAGVFDLIEVDLASARVALDERKLYAAVVLAARALLVTQGQEARDDAGALRLFKTHFLDAGLVDGSLRAAVSDAQRCAEGPEPERTFKTDAEVVSALVDAVQALYDGMDSSLRFRPSTDPAKPQPEPVTAHADRKVDFRGVACPLNYVKARLVLAQMTGGQTLLVLLDEEGSRNVPESVANDGHAVLSVIPQDDHWRVLIRKQ